MDLSEELLLQTLDRWVHRTEIQNVVKDLMLRARNELNADPDRTAVSLPIELPTSSLPPPIQSCRLFVLRASNKADIERHRNSYQRVVSFAGKGSIRSLGPAGWQLQQLSSDRSLPLERRWHGVGEKIWHQPMAGPEDWVAIAFHTALESDLQDEYWGGEATTI